MYNLELLMKLVIIEEKRMSDSQLTLIVHHTGAFSLTANGPSLR